MRTALHKLYPLAFAISAVACSADDSPVKRGDMSRSGGTATVRKPFVPQSDDPGTSNDESNDQPAGHFGTVTVSVTNQGSGNTYSLDADIEGQILHRLYFEKGGWVDFPCDCGRIS